LAVSTLSSAPVKTLVDASKTPHWLDPRPSVSLLFVSPKMGTRQGQSGSLALLINKSGPSIRRTVDGKKSDAMCVVLGVFYHIDYGFRMSQPENFIFSIFLHHFLLF
jgi:hypothetical protein